jgi:hypothetical protein
MMIYNNVLGPLLRLDGSKTKKNEKQKIKKIKNE